MEKSQVEKILYNHNLIRDLNIESKQLLLKGYSLISKEAGSTFSIEDHQDALLFLVEGNAVIHEVIGDQDYFLGSVSKGYLFNLEVLTDSELTFSNKVKCLNEIKLVKIPLSAVEELKKDKEQYARFLECALKISKKNLYERESQIIIDGENKFLAEKRKRKSALYIVFMITSLIVFMYFLGILTFLINTYPAYSKFTTFSGFFVVCIAVICWVRGSGIDLVDFGITKRRWKKHLFQSFIATCCFLSLSFLLKLYLINTVESVKDFPLFFYERLFEKYGVPFTVISILLYMSTGPIQQLIFRAGVQAPLNHLIDFKQKNMISIFVATIFFGSIHLPFGLPVALVMLLPGLFWAVMFQKQQSLIGVAFSHIMVAFWAASIGGEFSLIRALTSS